MELIDLHLHPFANTVKKATFLFFSRDFGDLGEEVTGVEPITKSVVWRLLTVEFYKNILKYNALHPFGFITVLHAPHPFVCVLAPYCTSKYSRSMHYILLFLF